MLVGKCLPCSTWCVSASVCVSVHMCIYASVVLMNKCLHWKLSMHHALKDMAVRRKINGKLPKMD